MDAKAELLRELDSAKHNQIALLRSFVQAASPNPPGNTEAAAAILTNYLTRKSIPFDVIEPQRGSPNIVSEFQGGKGTGPRVVLNGHIDVFPVGNTTGWTYDPYSGNIENGRIHGRGVVDMKSGTASLVIAYAALYERRELLKGSVALCAVSDEETGGRWGTQYLIKQDRLRWRGDVMLSAEPTGQTIRFSEKGTLRFSGVVVTRGAHGAYLNLSKGAIRTATGFLADAIEAIESMDVNAPPEIAAHLSNPETLAVIDRAMGPGTSTIIARPTVNIGTIKGGLKVNMIPDTCEFELDIRLPVGLTADEVLAVLDTTRQRYQDATITLRKQEAASNPSSFSPIDHPMISCLRYNGHLVGGVYPVATPSMGATDCKHYRYAGVPAYVYGCSPVSMASVNESASIDEFLHVTKTHALATWDFLQ
ncbi:hypothetical protein BDV59DRAFT_175928 [Aspergillus ambiguus]|uniref:uncharacterized protein n=1 Tax=Aspergillus ambiguus TaxID=176160 RepID=UPI003CCCD80E